MVPSIWNWRNATREWEWAAWVGDGKCVERREWYRQGANRMRCGIPEPCNAPFALGFPYLATDAECSPITPMTISPSDTIFTVEAGSLK